MENIRLETREIYVYRDVNFFEDGFPFSQPQTNHAATGGVENTPTLDNSDGLYNFDHQGSVQELEAVAEIVPNTESRGDDAEIVPNTESQGDDAARPDPLFLVSDRELANRGSFSAEGTEGGNGASGPDNAADPNGVSPGPVNSVPSNEPKRSERPHKRPNHLSDYVCNSMMPKDPPTTSTTSK